MSRTPSVVLVGAPNVGKSTLFNRLSRRRRALVHKRPGMTRDRLRARVTLDGRAVELVDTGGVLPDAPGAMEREITRQALSAAGSGDVVLVVVDGRLGLSPIDRHIVDALRRRGTAPVLVVNKLDTLELLPLAAEFYRLGVEEVIAVSAAHGLGMEDLRRAVLERLPAATGRQLATGPQAIALGLVGRPNVGKSSLLNRLLNEERVLVSETPGTTRDAVDTLLQAHGHLFRLVDTAGLRRRRRAADVPETLAMAQARSTLRRVDIAVLVTDATAGITTGDIAVAGLALSTGRAVLPLLNKWDLIPDRPATAAGRRQESATKLKFLPESTPLTVSAHTGLRVRRILSEAVQIFEHFAAHRPTALWNRALRAAVSERRPPVVERQPFRFYYAVQTGTRPPAVDIFVNSDRDLPEAYRRFLENRLRAGTGLHRTPLRLTLRPRTGEYRQRRGRARA